MPELPEVETIKRDLQKLIVGKKIAAITAATAKQLKPSPAAVQQGMAGATIKKVGRRAKIILIHLSNQKILAVHLKLTGRLIYQRHLRGGRMDSSEVSIAGKYTRVIIKFTDGSELVFNDQRQFGWMKIMSNHELRMMNHEFGPDALEELTQEQLKKALGSSRWSVKVALMDQKKISGIGNIYASEALFLAKIDPRQPANKIPPLAVKALYQAIEKVLKAGLKYRGASDQHYLDALGQKGHYQEHFLVYGRAGENCMRCGAKITKIALAGRGTCFCHKCQKV